MNTPIEVVLSELELTSDILTLPNDTKQEYLYFYERLLLANKDKSSIEYTEVMNNSYTYSVLLNKLVFMTLVKGTTSLAMSEMERLKLLPSAISKFKGIAPNESVAFKELYKSLKAIANIEPIKVNNFAELGMAVASFGVQSANEDDIPDNFETASKDEEDAIFGNDSDDDTLFENNNETEEDDVNDKQNIINSTINDIKAIIEEAESTKIDKITFLNNTDYENPLNITGLKINIDEKYVIDITVKVEDSLIEGEDYEIDIVCESADNELNISDEDYKVIAENAIEYIDKKLLTVEVKETTDDFDSTTDDVDSTTDDVDLTTDAENSVNDEENAGNTEDEETNDVTNKEQKEQVEKLFKAQIDNEVNSIVRILLSIYESNFSSVPHSGILVKRGDSNPLIKLKDTLPNNSDYSSLESAMDAGTSYDFIIADTLSNLISTFGSNSFLDEFIDDKQKHSLPSIDILSKSDGVCADLHLQLQSANVDYCKGQLSIRKWIRETQLKDSGLSSVDEWIKTKLHGRKLTSFKHVKSWYTWSIKNIILDALVENDVKSLSDIQKLSDVIGAIKKNIRNIVVVSDRAVGEIEEIKISCNSTLDVESISNALQSKLNIGNSNDITIKQVAVDNFNNYNVLTLQIVFNEAKANSSSKFAYEVIDRLADAGSLPSWDHALLGKKEDGTYLFWDDFTGSAEPYKRNYTIYAGSRSGKGVMTSTLIASAMCDKRHVFYTDGKPENGACLGEIAWEQGKEAYVFDGQASGKKPYQGYMENYTNNMRKPDEVASFIEKCPSELFENKSYFTRELQQKFLGVMRYLKSLQLCATIAYKRSSAVLPMNDWQVWIFDEMTDMTNNEKEIRATFARYVRNKTGAKDLSEEDADYYKIKFDKMKPEQTEQGNEKYDEGLDYIRKWVKWASGIRHLASNLSTISMGKAAMNLIFIFQEATWLADRGNKVCTICKVVKQLKSTKIVGRNALANACGEYGEGTTLKTDWYSKIQKGGQWWAISSSSDVRTANMKLFRPFNVWTTPLTPDGDKDPNGAKPGEEERYLKPYITNLLSRVNVNPADLLQESYDYAENAVKTLGYANSLKEYIYDCTNFAIDNTDASYDALHKGYTDDDDEDYESEGNKPSGAFSLAVDDAAGDKVYDKNSNPPTRIIPVGSLIKHYSDDAIRKYFDNYYNRAIRVRVSRGLKYDDTVSIQKSKILLDNYHFLSTKYSLPKDDIIQIYSNNMSNPVSVISLRILQALDNGEIKYDQIPTPAQLKSWTEINNNTSYNSNSQQSIHLNPVERQNIIAEVKEIAREMKAAGEFEGLSREEVEAIVSELIMELINGGTEV